MLSPTQNLLIGGDGITKTNQFAASQITSTSFCESSTLPVISDKAAPSVVFNANALARLMVVLGSGGFRFPENDAAEFRNLVIDRFDDPFHGRAVIGGRSLGVIDAADRLIGSLVHHHADVAVVGFRCADQIATVSPALRLRISLKMTLPKFQEILVIDRFDDPFHGRAVIGVCPWGSLTPTLTA